jgi:hypothetical protein
VDLIIMGKPGWPENLLNLALLPLNYFLELGFFFLAGLLYFQSAVRDRKTLVDRLGIDLLLLATSGLICSFFRSAIIGNNDIGWRGLMPVQFILLLWSANVLVSIWKKRFGDVHLAFPINGSALIQKSLAVLLVIGLTSTLFDLAYLRGYAILADEMHWTTPIYGRQETDWGKRFYGIREAYRFIGSRYPLTAIVQNNPRVESMVKTQGLYGMRQTAAAGKEYFFIYGASSSIYEAVSAPILPMFNDPALSFSEVEKRCRDSHIDILLMKDIDPVWKDIGSWVWKNAPVYQNDFVRVFLCQYFP